MPTRAAIGLGSNVGDREAHLQAATDALAFLGDVVRVSAWYETEPIGGPEQDPYLNAVAVIDTELGARELLNGLLAIERHRGRERTEKWGPRTLDLDLLIYGRKRVHEPGLTVPHPALAERRFVLQPLLEAWPGVSMPDGTLVEEFLPAVADQQVERLGRPQPAGATVVPRYAGIVVFLVVGLGAVVLWWIIDLLLP